MNMEWKSADKAAKRNFMTPSPPHLLLNQNHDKYEKKRSTPKIQKKNKEKQMNDLYSQNQENL